METYRETSKLSSLTIWSMQHIADIFESASDEKSLQAVRSTFSEDLIASINGTSITRDDITRMVVGLRQGAAGRLRVRWQQAVEVPNDASTNREGSFEGVYIVHGIQKILPGSTKPVEFERHKTVTVEIVSQSSNPNIDSRKIVSLAFVASDVRVHRQATL